MARGRMLSTEASVDPELNGLSQDALILYLLAIPHLDRDGLLDGHPVRLAARCAPLRVEIRDRAAQLIQEWETCGLVVGYDAAAGKRVLYFKGFRKHNLGMEYTREPASLFPPPPGWTRTTEGMVPAEPEECFRLADSFSQRSAYRRALLQAAGEDAPDFARSSRSVREDIANTSRLIKQNRSEANVVAGDHRSQSDFGSGGGEGGGRNPRRLGDLTDEEVRKACRVWGNEFGFDQQWRGTSWAEFVQGLARDGVEEAVRHLWAMRSMDMDAVRNVPGMFRYWLSSGETARVDEQEVTRWALHETHSLFENRLYLSSTDEEAEE